jgi:hypothetical protein
MLEGTPFEQVVTAETEPAKWDMAWSSGGRDRGASLPKPGRRRPKRCREGGAAHVALPGTGVVSHDTDGGAALGQQAEGGLGSVARSRHGGRGESARCAGLPEAVVERDAAIGMAG